MVFTLNIIAIINFLLLSTLFLVKKLNNKSNFLLSIIFLAPLLCHLFNLLVYQNLIYTYRYIAIVAMPIPFLWSPSVFFYTLFNVRERKSFRVTDILHLIPFILFLFFTLWLLFFSSQMHSFFYSVSSNTPFILDILNLVIITQIVVYLTISWIVIVRYNKKLKHLFSEVDRLSARCVQEFIILFVVFCVIVIATCLFGLEHDALLIVFPICSILFYVFVVFKSITCPIIFSSEEESLLQNINDEVGFLEDEYLNTQKTASEPCVQGKSTSILDDYMRKYKPYLNTGLNIKMLSEQLNVSVHCLSETINKNFDKNFFDFINQYRIEYAKHLLLTADFKKHTIESISNLSGFSSRSSFYTAFKKNTGISPGEYQKSINN